MRQSGQRWPAHQNFNAMKYALLFGATLLLTSCGEVKREEDAAAGSPNETTATDTTSNATTMSEAMEALTKAIDSSYAAIRLLEAEKAQLLAVPAAQLPPSGRLRRSTALHELNQLQTNIAAQTDSLILNKLKASTHRLDELADAMQDDVERLKLAAARLRAATQVVSRLTDYLTFCLSNSWIKPPTPATANPQEVKDQVLAMN